MIATSLLVLSLGVGTILLSIREQDEIHQLVAFLSGSIALICLFILSPLIVKGTLGALFLAIFHRLDSTYRKFDL